VDKTRIIYAKFLYDVACRKLLKSIIVSRRSGFTLAGPLCKCACVNISVFLSVSRTVLLHFLLNRFRMCRLCCFIRGYRPKALSHDQWQSGTVPCRHQISAVSLVQSTRLATWANDEIDVASDRGRHGDVDDDVTHRSSLVQSASVTVSDVLPRTASPQPIP